jgi:fibronectin-binding autotransporter adhesin
LQFNTAASIGGTGVSVSVATGAADAAGYAINQAFLARITSTSTGSAALAISSANNLDFSSATGANLPNVSLGAVGNASFTGTLTPYGNPYLLGGGGGTLTLPNVQLTGTNSVMVVGPGTVAPTGANTYTGITTITAGGRFAPTVALGGTASGMGQSSNSSSNLIIDGGTFAGVGSTDRSFTLTTNGGSLDNSGGLYFTGPGTVALPAGVNTTLTLTGTNTGHNTFNLSLADPGGGFVTSILKTGTGKWTFSADGTKTYSGQTHITAGELEALSGDAFSHYSDLNIDSSGVLDMHDNNVTINGLLGSGAIYDNFISGTKTLTIGAQNDGGNWAGNIDSSATLNVVKQGTGTEIFSAANTYVGNTTVAGGTLTISSTGSVISTALYTNAGATLNLIGSAPSGTLINSSGITNIGPNAGSGIQIRTMGSITLGSTGQVNLIDSTSRANRTLLVTSGLTFGGNTNSWQGKLDLAGNDLVINNGSIASLTNQVEQAYNSGHWNGTGGIFSSTAAANTTHLTTIGIIQNSLDGTPTGTPIFSSSNLFDGYTPLASDVLAKYTYYGDTNLDGSVNSADYARIDNGYLNQLTGWFNGDFNYDGVVNGSDYTLIDNAFNTQGAALTSQLAVPTAQSAGNPVSQSVPEPSVPLAAVFGITTLLSRRRRHMPLVAENEMNRLG